MVFSMNQVKNPGSTFPLWQYNEEWAQKIVKIGYIQQNYEDTGPGRVNRNVF